MNEERVYMMLRWMRRVEDQLKAYTGDEIVAGEHPLHKAVVELEHLCIERPETHDRLPNHVQTLWYQLLHASRTGWLRETNPLNSDKELNDWLSTFDTEELLKVLTNMMLLAIQSSMAWVELVMHTNGDLPLRRNRDVRAMLEQAHQQRKKNEQEVQT